MARRILVTVTTALTTAAVVIGSLLVPQAHAAEAAPLPQTAPPVVDNPAGAVTADALPTAQINGVVWDQAVVGNTVYAVGQFTSARPAGAAPGTNEVPRSNAMAYDIRTGVMTSWAPAVNGRIRGISASPDGSRVYIVGSFTQVDGKTRSRIAAFNTSDGSLVSSFAPVINSDAFSVTATDQTVYVGGWFTAVSNTPRSRLAAVRASDGALTGWAPTASGTVYGVGLTEAQDRVVVTGSFEELNGQAATSIGSIDATTGTSYPFAANRVVHNTGNSASLMSLKVKGSTAYTSGYWFGGTGNFEGGLVVDAYDGTIRNLINCLGDTYDIAPMNGLVYMASHHHQCTDSGGFPEETDRIWQYLDAFTEQASGTVQANTYGYPNFAGNPSGSSVTWWPTMKSGTYTGTAQAGWTIESSGNYLLAGGEFVQVNGASQQGLVRFATRAVQENPVKIGAQSTWNATAATVRSISADTARVSFTANYDRDGLGMSYKVTRSDKGQNNPVYSTDVDSTWWNRPVTTFEDTGLTPGASYTYRVIATDADGNASTGKATTIIAGEGAPPSSDYSRQVFADGASNYWRLDDAVGSTTIADWASGNDMTVNGGITFRTDGADKGSSDTAATLAGNTQAPATTTKSTRGPDTFTQELWFRTTSTSGGKLLGFGNASTGNSTSYDRHIYLSNDGRITFGVYPGAIKRLTSGAGYNDGQWHQVVATLSPAGQVLYVDGRKIAQDASTVSGEPYGGYWRIGGDNTSGWPDAGSSSSFTGDIDDVAIYPSALSLTQVRDHYTKSGRTLDVVAPTDTYGTAVWQDEPTLFWRLDEAAGPVAGDASGNGNTGEYLDGASPGAASPVTGEDGLGASFDGVNDTVASTQAFSDPRNFTVESWFSTTSTSGGKIIGLGSSRSGTSSNYDRHVYLDAAGHLNFGIWSGSADVVTTPGTYNDGAWHQVVASLDGSGMRLYVDGELVTTSAANAPQAFTGYWRIGGDSSWSGSAFLAGRIDEVAVYPTALSAGRVRAHYLASSVAPTGTNEDPAAAFVSSVGGLGVSVDGSGSSDSDGSVVSWVWDFGDGSSGSGVQASHEYASAGTYAVTLTVSDDKGATHSVTHEVTVAPVVVNVDPVAAFVSSVGGLGVSVDGSGSSDSDGSVVSWVWDFGDGSSGSGVQASHEYASAGTYAVTLTVSDDKGATHSVTHEVEVSAPEEPGEPEEPGVVAEDGFDRSGASGWGQAGTGGAWTVSTASVFSVNGSAGVVALPRAGSTQTATLKSVSAQDVSVLTDFTLESAPTSAYYHYVLARVNGSSAYQAAVRVRADGKADVYLSRVVEGVSTNLRTVTLSSFGYAAGEKVNVRMDLSGSGTTDVSAWVWKGSGAQPQAVTAQASDSTESLQAPGALSLKFYTGSGMTPMPYRITIDTYRVEQP